MIAKHRWILIYDIKDAKRLRKVAKLSESYGLRVQKSVFELYADRKTIEHIEKSIKHILEDEDSLAIIPLCIKDWEKTVRYGLENKEYYDPKEDDKEIFL
ncbi:CRISPR-associated endonuclease Cas2 [Spirochaetia bacterium 38H-sp]|uniref:CRISPR-associated endoribonuclease Cas2 n=1 Tax=Rarispira pelagica TaxID=3141764 RepID=A0ABU9U8N0_9SPIR